MNNVMAIALGAACGACLRWVLGLLLAGTASWLAMGTLAANWIGAFMIGVFAGWDQVLPEISPHIRLLAVTGFLGGLTTFSGFSLEIVTLLQAQRYAAATAAVSLHLFGSLLLTMLGIWCVQYFRG